MATSQLDRLIHIMEAPDRELDLAEAALLVAQEEYPGLDVRTYLGHITRLAANVCRRLPKEPGIGDAVFTLNEYLFDVEGFAGNAGDRHDPHNVFLNQVMDLRRGGPIALAILYVTVGRCLGLPLQAIALPSHFLVKIPMEEGSIVLDPYAGGVVLDDLALRALLSRVYGEDVPADLVPLVTSPAGKRELVTRMLRELKRDFVKRQRYDKALWASDLLLRLAPEMADEVRERAYFYECLQHTRGALADYTHYLEMMPHARDAADVRRRIATLRGRGFLLH
jgi:regulator of sirC expression with transglutaminase-like and TPR domain